MWVIDVTNDTGVIENAWEWYSILPDWLRSKSLAKYKKKDDFIKHFKNDCLFYGQDGSEGSVLVVAEITALKTYEGHLFCPRFADPHLVSAVIRYGTNWVFKYTDCDRVINVVRTRHWGLKKIVENAGFVKTGYSLWDSAAATGKVFEGKLYIANRGDYEKK